MRLECSPTPISPTARTLIFADYYADFRRYNFSSALIRVPSAFIRDLVVDKMSRVFGNLLSPGKFSAQPAIE